MFELPHSTTRTLEPGCIVKGTLNVDVIIPAAWSVLPTANPVAASSASPAPPSKGPPLPSPIDPSFPGGTLSKWTRPQAAELVSTINDTHAAHTHQAYRDEWQLETSRPASGIGWYCPAVVLVFNLAAGAIAALAVAAAAIAHVAGYDPYWLLAAFGTMTIVGGALELAPNPSWHPRYFWIVPAWLLGLVGSGAAMFETVDPIAGYVTLGVAGAAFVAVLVHAYLTKPGGTWLAGLVGSGAIVSAWQWIGYARPEWKHPVLYVVNGAAMIAMVVFGVLLYRSRRAAASA